MIDKSIDELRKFPLKYPNAIYSQTLIQELMKKRDYLKQSVDGFKSMIESFEKKSHIPKPKKPWLIKTSKYKKGLEKWEEEMGNSRYNYEVLILNYVIRYIELKELERQWGQLRQYLSDVIGGGDELAKFSL